jgi:antitoxin (DNA-binding transcriptional repressor) of toxin-antitoxin stability system
MRAIGIKVLKNKLSEYVRLAADGETILVTDRDRVVAELSPPRPSRAPEVADALIADAVREGWLRPAVTPPGALASRRPTDPLAHLLDELAEDRGER